MSTSHKKEDPKFVMAYDRAMLRSAFVSLFWSIISVRKQSGLTLVALAKRMGSNKAEVSRWFGGDPNWTVNTIASLANALNVDLRIEAVDRATGEIFRSDGTRIDANATSMSTHLSPSLPSVKITRIAPGVGVERFPITSSKAA